MKYLGRPTISPVIAGLFAAGLIKKSNAVLDVGCGTGLDCLTLASWGVRRVVGIDDADEDLELADNRLMRLDRQGELRANVIEWHAGSITAQHECFRDREFDVVLDSLLVNNIALRSRPQYVSQLARIMKPEGLLVLQYRSGDPKYGRVPSSQVVAPRALDRYFKLGNAVTTDLAEFASAGGKTKRCRVTVLVGRRRKRNRS